MQILRQHKNPEDSTKQSGLVIHGDFIPDLRVQMLDGLMVNEWVMHTHYLSRDMSTCAVGLPTYGVVLVYRLSMTGWTKVATIRSLEINSTQFGKAVGVSNDGSVILIGDQGFPKDGGQEGAVFCYVSRRAEEWSLEGYLSPSKGKHGFGSVISVKNGYFYVYDTSGGVFMDPLKLKRGTEKNMVVYKEVKIEDQVPQEASQGC